MADEKDKDKVKGKGGEDEEKRKPQGIVGKSSKLGELLLREKVVTIELLDKARAQIATRGGSLIQHLADLGVAEEAIVKNISQTLGIPTVDMDKVDIPVEVLKKIPRQVAIRYGIVPLELIDGKLTVAMSDPFNMYAMDDLKMMYKFKSVEPVVTSESALEKAIKEFYPEDTMDDVLQNADLTKEDIEILRGEEGIDAAQLARDSEDQNVVRLVNLIFLDAIRKGASDIHFEGFEKDFIVRYRIDGVLVESMRPPLKYRDAVVSRIKILSQLNIAERRLPQDGRIKMKFGKKEVDFRVSILACITGENAVLRILDKSALQLDMTKLGFQPDQLVQFKKAANAPWGMVLVTGPTGSGKTTTLYSALMELNKPNVKVLTVENPVEITVPGINQVQVQDDIGRTFAAALRSFLRQDPDIIMVGEVRDFETAEIAIKAALTGHLVLSTLHTNDAPSTINRLMNMGIEPFLITASINLIVAQRLVRVICKHCKEELEVPTALLAELGIPTEEIKKAKVYHGVGCKLCNNTGYKGRLALFEILPIDDAMKEGIMSGFTATELHRLAVKNGMVTLRQSGIAKVLQGVTTIEEVLRITKQSG